MEPFQLHAREIVHLIESAQASAHEVALSVCHQVTRINPRINALIDFDEGAVLQQARAVDARLASGEYLPLAGVPVSIKDNIWIGGRHASFGSRCFEEFVAPRDAWCVQRLRACGAIILGSSNCSEFACKGVTSNLLHGETLNPWNPDCTPGGSSGGAVAAVAAGMGPLALATDAGGSTRRPAAHTGLVGMKPTLGRIPHPWGFQDPNQSLSCIGQVGRDVADVSLLTRLLFGFQAADLYSVPGIEQLNMGAEGSRRIAYSADLGLGYRLDDEVRAVLENVMEQLAGAGWQIEEVAPEWPDEIRHVSLMSLQHAGLARLFGERQAQHPELFDPAIAAQIEAGRHVSGQEMAACLMLRERIVACLAEFFSRYPLLFCPTVPVEAWPHDLIGPQCIGGQPAGPRDHAVFTPLFNFGGVPALSLPCGFGRHGLPLGLQIVGARYADFMIMNTAQVVEDLLGEEFSSPMMNLS